MGSMPSSTRLPANTSANKPRSATSDGRSSSAAASGDHATSLGSLTGVGITRE